MKSKQQRFTEVPRTGPLATAPQPSAAPFLGSRYPLLFKHHPLPSLTRSSHQSTFLTQGHSESWPLLVLWTVRCPVLLPPHMQKLSRTIAEALA